MDIGAEKGLFVLKGAIRKKQQHNKIDGRHRRKASAPLYLHNGVQFFSILTAWLGNIVTFYGIYTVAHNGFHLPVFTKFCGLIPIN